MAVYTSGCNLVELPSVDGMWASSFKMAENSLALDRLKYIHIELAICFLVTNYVYPNKIYQLTYHSIAPVLSEKSP